MRRTRFLIRTLVLCAIVLAAAPSASALRARGGKFAIGDSVMLGAKEELHRKGFRVDAAVSRSFGTGVSILRQMRDAGTLPSKVLFHLGNNGYMTKSDCRTLVRATGKARTVWVVTLKVPRGWEKPNNRLLVRCARSKETIELIDWREHAADHAGWFYSDGYHLTPLGQRRYAGYVDRYVPG